MGIIIDQEAIPKILAKYGGISDRWGENFPPIDVSAKICDFWPLLYVMLNAGYARGGVALDPTFE